MFFPKRLWASIRPAREARQGALLAAAITVAWAAVMGAQELQSGFGFWVDLLFTTCLAAIGIPLVTLLIALLLAILRHLPPMRTGFFAACLAGLCLLWLSQEGAALAALLLLVECVFGATLAAIFLGRLRHASVVKRILTIGLFLLALAANVVIFRFLGSDGISEDLLVIHAKQPDDPPEITAADPSLPGPYSVRTLFYGSGDSLRRSEFGPLVAIRTQPVDASHFFKDFSGWKAWIRKRYWGFGVDKLPLNAEVFYPQGAGPFPLFVLVHGNYTMSVASDTGYGYLCKLLASRGFIAVSIDENFLNSGLFDDLPNEQAVRGWLILEHLRVWHGWAHDPKSLFFGKVDLNNIAVGGHSRGGEAAATAALFNNLAYDPDDATIAFHYGYKIRSVLAIAPVDGQYKPAEQPRVLRDINYLTLQGSNDSDVSTFDGSRQYDHVHFSGAVPAFKSELYIYRANHGQFNEKWGRSDRRAPLSWFLNVRPLLPGDAQQQIAKVYTSSFLEATLHGRSEYIDVFRDYRRARRWLPRTLYLNRFQDQTYKTICAYNEDADVTTTTLPGGRISAARLTVWREARIPFRSGDRGYNGVFLGWNRDQAKNLSQPPQYTIDLPSAQTAQAVDLSVAATDDDTADQNDQVTDFSIEAADGQGKTGRLAVSSFRWLLPPLHVQFTKWEWLDDRLLKNSAEPVFQTFRFPLSAFHLQEVKRIRLIFNKTPSRVIILSGIGLDND